MELLVNTLSLDSQGVIRLDTVLGNGVLVSNGEVNSAAYLRAATSYQASTTALPGLSVPPAVQALVAAPSLYEGLAEALWEQIVMDRVLNHVRTRLFS